MTKKLIRHFSDWHAFDTIRYQLEKYKTETKPDIILVTGDMVVDMPGWPYHVKTLKGLKKIADGQKGYWKKQVFEIQEIYPNTPIVAVPGNHCWFDYAMDGVKSFDKNGVHSFTVDGVKFTGFRGVPEFVKQWSHELSEESINKLIIKLDKTADVLITHTPPYGILDYVPWSCEHTGAIGLAEWVRDSSVQLHAFGHIHEAGGKVEIKYNKIFSNAAGRSNDIVIDT